MDTSQINLISPGADLYDRVAEAAAKSVAPQEKWSSVNKASQLRRFYDELVMWDQRVRQHPGKYNEFLPLIKMINAKAAYAGGRKLVDDNFVTLMRHCLGQLRPDKPEIFHNCKTFFEAFMGFYKLHGPNK